MVNARKLNSAEMAIARSVYTNVLPFDRIYLTDLNLGGAVTLASMDLQTGKFDYTINWVDGFRGGTGDAEMRATLIHELCHVWQGEHGVWPTFYMGQSIWAQVSSGVRDIWRKRKWRGWGEHRSTAYPLPADGIGKDWSNFNVEQQATLVESWYMPERDRVTPAGPGLVRVHNFGLGYMAADDLSMMPAFHTSAT